MLPVPIKNQTKHDHPESFHGCKGNHEVSGCENHEAGDPGVSCSIEGNDLAHDDDADCDEGAGHTPDQRVCALDAEST